MGAVLTPDVGSPILPTDPVLFDLTDASETLTSVLIAVRHDTGVIELAHDGTSFTSFYASGSSRTVITNGFHYSLVRAGGWADTKVAVSAFPFAGTGVGLINFSSDFGVLDDPPGEDVALSVTGATAGPFGNASHVATFTVDSKGRLTASGQTAIILTDNSSSPIAHVGSGGATATSAANIGDVNTAVAAEATARAAADTTLTTNLATETTARIAGDTTLTTNLNTEITNRIAGDTTLTTNLATETAARIAGDAAVTALIPAAASTAPANVTKTAAAVGTGSTFARADHKHDVTTSAPGDVGTSNTEGTSTSLARADHVHNVPFTSVAAALAAATADVSVNSHKITNLASGGATPTNAATIADVLAASAISVANETALAALDATNLPTGTRVRVATYRCFWVLDKSTTRTALANRVRAATGGAGWWWVRELGQGDPFWQAQTAWWIDPAGTAGTPGNDEADGLSSSTPITSIAEWRRRINGAIYSSDVIIHALSGSTVTDDGFFYGFGTPDLQISVRLVGVPVAIGVSGTVAGYQPYAGNTRGSFSDASIPTSWTASGAISGSSGSRWVRKTGTGVRHYSQLLKDLGSKTVQFGVVVDWDETDAVTVRQTETNFTNGDAYEVVSLAQWPVPNVTTGNVLVQNFDILGLVLPNARQGFESGGQLRYRLCGFPQNIGFVGSAIFYSCVFCMASPNGVTLNLTTLTWVNCSACNTAIIQIQAALSWHTLTNVFCAAELRVWHGGNVGSFGFLRMHDCATPLVSVRHNASVRLSDTIVGSGNTGALVLCDNAGLFYGAATISATTSKASPWTVSGVDFAAPVVDGGSGDGIHN